MTKREQHKQEIQRWKDLCGNSNSFVGGNMVIHFPPDIPGLKRLRKKQIKLYQFLELHPRKQK